MKRNHEAFLTKLINQFGDQATVNRTDVVEFAKSVGATIGDYNWLFCDKNRASRGEYTLPESAVAMAADIVPIRSRQMFANSVAKFDPNAESDHAYAAVPDQDPIYIPFGEYKMIENIIKLGAFFPVFISGLSGYGKTMMIEQGCARVGQSMIRVQMSRETDEDDLIGGFRLVNGETKFMKGPVLRAMELGALLLIDEADRADPGKIMCLQGILEGKPYYVKKTGEIVSAKKGFNVIVTANTKGRGSDDGRYVAATILDDAWLERFPITIEQPFPSAKIEQQIVESFIEDKQFAEHLVMWSEIIRKTFVEGAINDLISTRRLVHIAKTYNLINNRMKAIELCTNRFDEETKTAFLDLYSKVDPTINPVVVQSEASDLKVEESSSADALPT